MENMKNHVFCIIVIATIILIGCKTKSQDHVFHCKEINITDNNASSKTDYDNYLSQIVVEVDLTFLQTQDAPQIKHIKKIAFHNNKLFIYQGHTNPILVYNQDGNYIKSIVNFGKGPQEIIELRDFDILSDGSLAILDYQKIHYYDKYLNYSNAVLLSSFPTVGSGFAPMNIIYKDEHILLWDGSGVESSNALLIFNTRVNNIGQYIKVLSPSAPSSPFRLSSYGDTVLIMPPFLNDTIYQFINGKCTPRYLVSFQSESSDAALKKQSTSGSNFQELYQYIFEHKLSTILNGFETTHFFAFNYMYNTKMYRGVFNKSERSVITSIDYGFENLFNFPVSSVKYADKTHLVSVLEPYILTKLISEGKTACAFIPETRRLQLLEKLKDVKETDNPVLMLVTFKE